MKKLKFDPNNLPVMLFYQIENDSAIKDNSHEQQFSTQKLNKNLNKMKDEENEIQEKKNEIKEKENSIKQKIKELEYQLEKEKEENSNIKKYNNYFLMKMNI